MCRKSPTRIPRFMLNSVSLLRALGDSVRVITLLNQHKAVATCVGDDLQVYSVIVWKPKGAKLNELSINRDLSKERDLIKLKIDLRRPERHLQELEQQNKLHNLQVTHDGVIFNINISPLTKDPQLRGYHRVH